MAGGQSLRLSTDNEQNLCNLAHCGVFTCLNPNYPQASRWGRQGGVNEWENRQICDHHRASRSSRYWGCRVPHAKHSPRLSVRFTTTGASPTLPIYIVPSAQCRCSFAPICLTRLPGRTEARPYDRMVFSAMYHVENKESRVAACCDLPGDSFSFCRVSD